MVQALDIKMKREGLFSFCDAFFTASREHPSRAHGVPRSRARAAGYSSPCLGYFIQ